MALIVVGVRRLYARIDWSLLDYDENYFDDDDFRDSRDLKSKKSDFKSSKVFQHAKLSAPIISV